MSPIIAWIVIHTSWRWSFLILGSTGIIWVFLWLKLFRAPAECPWLPAAERDYILSRTDQATTKRAAEVPKGAVLRY